ncbi:hypothetical protein M5K25_017436 [Dendrobium thyrsiflorum]|uniref:Uncharacterized protein n=1 Tax=Dendrobium thyrsiflorum TaxID=117978 RepID=A0ABD0UU56_DENTH
MYQQWPRRLLWHPEALKTIENLAKKNFVIDKQYILSLSAAKSTSHLFFGRDCSFSVVAGLIPRLSQFLMRPNLLQLFDFVHELDFLTLDAKNPLMFLFVVLFIIFGKTIMVGNLVQSMLELLPLCLR